MDKLQLITEFWELWDTVEKALSDTKPHGAFLDDLRVVDEKVVATISFYEDGAHKCESVELL